MFTFIIKICGVVFFMIFCSFGANAEIITKWDIYEINLSTTNDYKNPYIDVWLIANLTDPDGEKNDIYGFWDGESNWKIRIVPTKAGIWHYKISSNEPLFNGNEASFNVIESGKKGFVVRDVNYPFAFRRSNGDHIFLMGDTCWNCMSDQDDNMNFTIFKKLVDNRSKQNFNFIRSYIFPFYADPNSGAHYNEGGRGFEPYNPDELNPRYFQEADKRIIYANSKGITMHLLFGSDQQSMTDFFGWDNGKMERYIRYIVARYSAFDISWEGRAEFEEQKKNPGSIKLANQLGHWLEKYDAYSHLQSIHTLDSNNELGTEKWLDWIMHQSTEWRLITEDRKFNKPVMNEEFYYEDSGAGRTHSHHVDSDMVRKGAWMIMTNGASGLAYGNTGTYNSRSQPFRGIEYSRSKGADYMTYLYNFWIETEYWNLNPYNNIILNGTGSAVINENEYIIYLPNGGYVDLDFNRMECNFNAEWYNPRNGTFQGRTIIEGGALINFKAPNSEDWVLYINSIDGCFTPIQSLNISKNNLFYKLFSPFINYYKILKYKFN